MLVIAGGHDLNDECMFEVSDLCVQVWSAYVFFFFFFFFFLFLFLFSNSLITFPPSLQQSLQYVNYFPVSCVVSFPFDNCYS